MTTDKQGDAYANKGNPQKLWEKGDTVYCLCSAEVFIVGWINKKWLRCMSMSFPVHNMPGVSLIVTSTFLLGKQERLK